MSAYKLTSTRVAQYIKAGTLNETALLGTSSASSTKTSVPVSKASSGNPSCDIVAPFANASVAGRIISSKTGTFVFSKEMKKKE